MSGSDDNRIRLWNCATRQVSSLLLVECEFTVLFQSQVLTGHSDRVLSVAVFCQDHFIVSGGSDKTVRVWSVATGEATSCSAVQRVL